MAKITENASLVSLASTFTRTNGQPIDDSILFDSLDKARTYARTSTAYVGQILSVVESGTVTVYVISNQEGELSNLTDLGLDDKSITYVDDYIALNDFGKRYYSYNNDTQSYNTEPTVGWKNGLEPRVNNGKLVWYEPNPTTVQGLNSSISSLDSRVTTLENTPQVEVISSETIKALFNA